VAGVSAAAYTNNDLDPNTATTLFDLDTGLDQIAIQAPANSGQLSATGKLTVDAGSNAGFDIYSTVVDGSAVEVEGRATDMGGFFRTNQVFDLAIPLNQL